MAGWHSEFIKSLKLWNLPFKQANLNEKLKISKKIGKVV
jgi:hypothetical protein